MAPGLRGLAVHKAKPQLADPNRFAGRNVFVDDLTVAAQLGAAATIISTFDAHIAHVNPDGDVDLPDEAVARFRTVDCGICGTGMLKPDVVFFGETVPAPRVAECFVRVERARALLVLGSSLTVMSGRRFVIRAAKHGIPVAIVNQGPTRGDGHAALTLDAPLTVSASGRSSR